jgi:hypothetical protein
MWCARILPVCYAIIQIRHNTTFLECTGWKVSRAVKLKNTRSSRNVWRSLQSIKNLRNFRLGDEMTVCIISVQHWLMLSGSNWESSIDQALCSEHWFTLAAGRLCVASSTVLLCGYKHSTAHAVLNDFSCILETCNSKEVSSGSIVSDYGLDDRVIGVRSPAGAKDLSSNLCVQTGSGAHPASCTMGTGGPFRGGKNAAGAWRWPLTPSSAEVENE